MAVVITYVGHACFLLEHAALRILLDPFEPGCFGGRISLAPFRGKVDVVVSTHPHRDHFHLDPSFGEPVTVTDDCEAAGVRFHAMNVPHGGREPVANRMFWFDFGGIRFLHPGDIGALPSPDSSRHLSGTDVLFLPVGGRFTLGPRGAWEFAQALRPRIVIPMHFRCPGVDLDIRPLDDFLRLLPCYDRPRSSRLEITQASLQRQPTRVIVLEPLSTLAAMSGVTRLDGDSRPKANTQC